MDERKIRAFFGGLAKNIVACDVVSVAASMELPIVITLHERTFVVSDPDKAKGLAAAYCNMMRSKRLASIEVNWARQEKKRGEEVCYETSSTYFDVDGNVVGSGLSNYFMVMTESGPKVQMIEIKKASFESLSLDLADFE